MRRRHLTWRTRSLAVSDALIAKRFHSGSDSPAPDSENQVLVKIIGE